MKKEKIRYKFTDAEVRNMKTTKRLQDTLEGDGFGVRVYGTGTKVFYHAYTFDGKRRFLNLGTYPIVSLADARKRHTAAKKKIDDGVDPLLEKITAKVDRTNIPFMSDLCKDYIKRHAKIKKRSWKLDEYLVNKEILPAWENRKASDISDRDIKVLLNSIVDRGAPASANRLRALIHMIFSFAIDELILKDNPCSKVKKPTKDKSRERCLSVTEIKTLWEALEGIDIRISQQTRNVLMTILLTAQRPGEVVGMHENEIDGQWWTIPSTRTKNKRAHRVFLSDSVIRIIGCMSGRGYIFPAGRGVVGHMTENALSFAIRRNIKGQSLTKDKIKRRKGEVYKRGPYKTQKNIPDNPNRIGLDMFTPHDLRRTAATLMATIKVPFETRERILNHTLSKMDGTYNMYDYDDEKQVAMMELERKIISSVNNIEYIDRNKKLQMLEDRERELNAREKAIEAREQTVN